MKDVTADAIISALRLQPHPEGGHFRETWRHVPPEGGRGAGTAIYFLLRSGEISRWHRVDATEIWLYHAGAPLRLEWRIADGVVEGCDLGPDVLRDQAPQVVIPPHAWQRAWSLGDYTLVSCTVSPAFQFEGFEMEP
jgi:predicted cupin superfamily sugar epimerase